MSVAPQPVVIQVVRTDAPVTYEAYNELAARVLGSSQVILGVLAIIFNIVAMGLKLETSYSGYALGAGIFWIIAGSFGIASALNKTVCKILTTMTLSVLSAAGMLGYLGSAIPQIVESTTLNNDKEGGAIAVSSLMLIIGLAELVVSITASVFCCRAVCCCSQQQTISAQPMGGNQVTVNTLSGPQSVVIPPGYQVVSPAIGSSDTKQAPTGFSPPPAYMGSLGY